MLQRRSSVLDDDEPALPANVSGHHYSSAELHHMAKDGAALIRSILRKDRDVFLAKEKAKEDRRVEMKRLARQLRREQAKARCSDSTESAGVRSASPVSPTGSASKSTSGLASPPPSGTRRAPKETPAAKRRRLFMARMGHG